VKIFDRAYRLMLLFFQHNNSKQATLLLSFLLILRPHFTRLEFSHSLRSKEP